MGDNIMNTIIRKILEIPLANQEDRRLGWTIDPDFIEELSRKKNIECSMEDIEDIICAMYEIPMTPQKDDSDV